MSSSFDDFSQQNSDALQSTIDSTSTSLLDSQSSSHDAYTQSAFDHNSLNETAYQSDSFSTENQWQNTAFQSTPEHSLNQEIDALLNGSDSSDDSNNQNASNLMAPTIHHAHYHPSHEHFNTPSLHEGERLASSESSTFHSSMDVNVSGSVDHYHRWVNPNDSYSGADGGSSNNYSNAPSSGASSSCTDANGDGQCDSGGSSCGDSGSCDSN